MRAQLLIAVCVLCCLAATCTDSAATADAGPATTPTVSPRLLEYAEVLANGIHAEAAAGKFDLLQSQFSQPAFLERALAAIDPPPEVLQHAMMAEPHAKLVAAELSIKVKAGASYRRVAVRLVEGQPRLLFRLYGIEGLNYHEWVIEQGPRGPRIVDVYDFRTGQLSSTTMQRMTRLLFHHHFVEGEEARKDAQKNLELMQRFNGQIRFGSYREALETFDSFPAGMKTEPLLLAARAQAAAQVGVDTFIKAVADFDRVQPGSPAIALIAIAAFLDMQKYEECGKELAKLDRRLGGDPFLDVIRARIADRKNERGKSREFLDAVIAKDPTFAAPYHERVELALRDKDFAAVVRLLAGAARNADVKWGDLKLDERFKEFVQSPEYQSWLREAPPQ